MASINGIICDGCGRSDVVSADSQNSEDLLPRNGWLSIAFWDRAGVASSPEMHACTPKCLKTLAKKLQESAENHANHHTHDHDH